MTNEQFADYQAYCRATMARLKRLSRVALWLTLPLLALIYFDQWQAWAIGFAVQMGCNLAHFLIGRRLDKRMDWVRAELTRDCQALDAELLRKLPPMGSA